MDKDLSFYYENSDNLTSREIEEFILKIINIEIKRLNIETPIKTIFLSNSNLDYGGALNPNYEKNTSGHFILPLKTKNYTLSINKCLIDELYKNLQNKSNNIDGILIPQTLNFISSIVSLCSHEVRHAYQNEKVKNNSVDEIESILWLKQDIVRDYFVDIYDLNYDNYLTEQDSNHYQYQLSFELLDKYSKLSSNELEKYKKYLKDRGIVQCINKKIDVLYKQVDDQKTDRKATAYVIELFNEIVKQLPKEFISNSLLKFEYNEDGTKKNYIELLNDKENYSKQGLNYDSLYDFIIMCDYNLQVQKLSLELEKSNSDDVLVRLKRSYHSQSFIYKDIHESLQKTQIKISNQIKKLSLERSKGNISVFDYSKQHIRLLKLSSMCKEIEKNILEKIKDYKYQKSEYLKEKEQYVKNMELIESYKIKKKILDIIKDGVGVDVTDYNKLIAMVIKELNDENIDNEYKEYLLEVKKAIQMIYFPSTLNNKHK